MPSVIQPFEGKPRAEYISPNRLTSIIIEAEGLTPEQVEAVMKTALEAVCDARGVAKPRLVADRTLGELGRRLEASP